MPRCIRLSLLLAFFSCFSTAQTNSYSQWPNGPSNDPNFFPIGVWLQSPGHAEEFKKIGINTYVGFWGNLDQTSLTQLSNTQMPLFPAQNSVALNSPQRSIIRGWTQSDEPDNAQADGGGGYGPCLTPAAIVSSYNSIRTNDSTRPVFLNFGRGVADTGWGGRGTCTGQTTTYYPAAIQGGDIISFDIYPVADYNGRLELVAQGIDNLKSWIAQGGKNKIIWNVVEAAPLDGGVVPSFNQVKAEVWMSLIHGSLGIIYFVHQLSPTFREDGIFNYPSLVQALTTINAQVRSLAPVLNSPTVANGVQTSFSLATTPLDAMVKRYNGDTYIFAVAMRNTPGTGTFSGLGTTNGTVEAIGENRKITMTNGRFQDNFNGYGVHLYKLATGPNAPTNLKIVVH
jgi:hypothetical protein